MRSRTLRSRIDPVISRSTFGAIAGSRRRDVERDDGAIGLARQPIDQPVADLAAGAGNEHDGFAHGEIIVGVRYRMFRVQRSALNLNLEPLNDDRHTSRISKG